MSDELTLSGAVRVNNGLDIYNETLSGSFDQTGTDAKLYTITVTDAGWTALDKASIGSLGLCTIRNMSETAGDVIYVSCDGGTTEHFELPPAAWMVLWLRSSATIGDFQVKAASGKTVLVKLHLREQ